MREAGRALLLLGVFVAVGFAPVVFLGRTLRPELYVPFGVTEAGPWEYRGRTPISTFDVDMATPAYYEAPLGRAVGRAYRSGELPLWNPHQGAGMPLLGQYSTAALFPYQILEDLAPAAAGDSFLLGRLWLAGLFTFLFLRQVGLSFGPAMLGAVLYMFSGTMVWFVQLEQLVNPAMVQPLLFFFIDRLARRGLPRDTAAVALGTALVLLAGQPETALYVLAMGGLYVIYRAVTAAPADRAIAPTLGRYTVASLLGIGLAAPLLLPFVEVISASFNLHPAGGRMGVVSPTPLAALAAIWTPTLFEKPAAQAIYPDNGHWDYLGGYAGVLGLVLALAAFTRAAPGGRWRREMIAFAAVGGFVMAKNLGVPPFVWIGYLPLFDQAWTPRWAGPLWTFSFAAAAAFAAESLFAPANALARTPASNESLTTHPRRGPRPGLVVAAVLSVVVYAYFVNMTGHARTPLSLLYVTPPGEGHEMYARGVGIAVAFATAAAVLMILSRAPSAANGWRALLLVALGELWFLIPRGYPPLWLCLKLIPLAMSFVGAAWAVRGRASLVAASVVGAALAYGAIDITAPRGLPDRVDPYQPAPYLRFLTANAGHGRIMAMRGVLYPNAASAFGLFDARIISALATESYNRFSTSGLRSAGSTVSGQPLWFTGLPSLGWNLGTTLTEVRANMPLYSLLGVRYFVLPHAARPRILEPPGAQGPTAFPLVYDAEVRIYENPAALPRAFVVHEVERVNGPDDAIKRIAAPDLDLRRRAVVETDIPAGALARPERAPSDPAQTTIASYGAGRVELVVRNPRPGLLVLTDTFFPGWTADVNGRRHEIVRVDGAFRGVWLAEGEHRIVFRYLPRTFLVGAAIGGACALVCLALLRLRRAAPARPAV